MTIDEKLELYEGMLQCGNTVYVWQYDSDGQLLSSNCPDEAALGGMFQVFGCKEEMYLRSDTASGPVILSSILGDSWFADFLREDGKTKRAVVVGPFLSESISFSKLEQAVKTISTGNTVIMSVSSQQKLLRALDKVSAIIPTTQIQFALMLHYCLTGEQISKSGIEFADAGIAAPRSTERIKKDRNKVWIYEQGLMRMLREGDLNFKQAVDNSSSLSNGIGMTSGSALRQAKNSVIVYISLVCRAAIEGGLSPEVAYSLGDAYIQSAEDVTSPGELGAISNTMYTDFIQRVHNLRVNPNYSKAIQIACDYIEQNAEGDLSMEAIATRVGYSDYYLSRKFKEEVHTSINDYIKIVKVERAKFLLGCTHDSIQDISEKLHFCSRSYFGETFRKIVGCSPVEYREKYKKG